MTEQTTETTEDQIHPDSGTNDDAPISDPAKTEETEQDDAEDHSADPVKAARKEAGKYRHKLRETEAERDQLREQLQATQWGVVAANLQGLKSVAPLQSAGHDLDEFLNDDGGVDVKKVHEIEAGFAETTGLSLMTAKQRADDQRRRDADALGSMDAGKRGSHAGTEISWSDAMSPQNR